MINSNKKPKIISIILMVLAFFMLLNFSQGFAGLVKNTATSISQPFAKFFSAMGYWLGDKIYFISSIGEMKKENQALIKENLVLKGQLATFQDAERENEELRREIGLAQRNKYNLEAAFVIGKDLSQRNEVIYIDKGSKDGVKKDMPVMVSESVMIGKVDEVFLNQARVSLVLNQGNNISVELENGEKGIVHGEYGTAMVLDMVSQTAQLNSRDAILTSGLSEDIPKGLLIGYIKELLPTADQLFQRTSVTLPYEIDRLRIVWVLKSVK